MAKVKVQQGWLAGAIMESVTGEGKYYSFRGVPYAQPPVGKLRFKAPQPPLPWEGIRTATEHGPMSAQVHYFTRKFVGSEDCLHLNVYSADLTPTKKMPVMVFIHGGGFKYGSANDDLYGPDLLVHQGVVLVTFNYRLEALGFLCLDTEEVPGNAALKDQVAALKWVKDNIVNFGGDPDNVTVFGESAGGCSTSLHLISPMSKGLFKKAIPLSGVPYCDWCLPFQPKKRAFLLGKDLGIETNDPNELLEFLQNVPVEKLVETNPIVLSFEDYNQDLYKLYHFTPVIEKDFGKGHNFLTEDPMEALKNKRINDADVLIGYAKEEAASGIPKFEASLLEKTNRFPELVVPRKLLMKITPETVLELSDRIREYYFKGKPLQMKEYVTFKSHVSFILDILRFATHLPKVGNGRRYMYKFSYVSDRNVYGSPGLNHGIREAGHMDILMYLFHAKFHDVKVVPNTKEFRMINLVRTLFTNFAKYGNPTPDSSLGAIWPEYDNTSKAYVEIEDKLVKKTAPEAEVVEFWSKIFETAGVEF